MKKLAIISSYDELCGNATYTKALKGGFSQEFQVDVFGVNVPLLKDMSSQRQCKANEYILDIAKKLRSYDYVNIQFEAGLYGVTANTIFKRMKLLIDHSQNCLITMHRFDHKVPVFSRLAFKLFLRFKIKSALRAWFHAWRKNHFNRLYEDIARYAQKKQAALLVHTLREKHAIQTLYGIKRVYDHPISFLTRDQAREYSLKAVNIGFKQRYRLTESDIVVGIFGFVSRYKAHDIAIKAIHCLPKNYKLLIFGGQHPFSIQENCPAQKDTQILLDLVEQYKLFDQVYFLGELSDEEFIIALCSCDVTVLPYIETNQSASGVAGLTLDVGVKSIFSMNYAFLELAKYAPNAFPMFTIGNYLELARLIQNLVMNRISYEPGLRRYQEQYNLDTNIAMHKKIFEETERIRQ